MIKIPTLFTKTPRHKRFNFTPRHYDPQEEERKAREERIQREVLAKGESEEIDVTYRARIAGSFRTARKSGSKGFDPSANLIRLLITTFLVVWIIAYLQFGKDALYALLLFVPFYLWIKFVRK
jgi:hypothetical protein